MGKTSYSDRQSVADTRLHIQTESAREARKAFYCDLCQKGYGRINEYEAHQGSYDHTHRKVCLPPFNPHILPYLSPSLFLSSFTFSLRNNFSPSPHSLSPPPYRHKPPPLIKPYQTNPTNHPLPPLPLHLQRLKDLKTLTRASDPTASARARRAEEKATADAIGGGGVISIKPISLGAGEKKSGFKKGGFRNAFAAVAGEGEGEEGDLVWGGDKALSKEAGGREGKRVGEDGSGGDKDDEEEEDDVGRWGDYDPRRPTGCGEWCAGHVHV